MVRGCLHLYILLVHQLILLFIFFSGQYVQRVVVFQYCGFQPVSGLLDSIPGHALPASRTDLCTTPRPPLCGSCCGGGDHDLLVRGLYRHGR